MTPLVHGDRELPLERGKTLFDYADSLSLRVPTSCRRDGTCHECIVEVRSGIDALSTPTPSEDFLRGNYRLACQASVEDPDAPIDFAILRRQPKILTHGVTREFEPNPVTVRRDSEVAANRRCLGNTVEQYTASPSTSAPPRS